VSGWERHAVEVAYEFWRVLDEFAIAAETDSRDRRCAFRVGALRNLPSELRLVELYNPESTIPFGNIPGGISQP